MSAAALLDDLFGRGVKVWAEGDELRYRGSKKVLTPETLDQLRAHKAEVIAHLCPAPEPPPAEPLKVTDVAPQGQDVITSPAEDREPIPKAPRGRAPFVCGRSTPR